MTWQYVVLSSIAIVTLGIVEWHALDLHIDHAELAIYAAIVAGAIGVVLPIRSPFERK